jgi:hypothetical protein
MVSSLSTEKQNLAGGAQFGNGRNRQVPLYAEMSGSGSAQVSMERNKKGTKWFDC